LVSLGTFVIVLLIVLLLFSDKLAGAGQGLGQAVRNFKRSVTGAAESDNAGTIEPPKLTPVVKQAPPKLLPAKGETYRGSDPPPDSEQRKA
jgi:Sec-independent protein translocase protein TatA